MRRFELHRRKDFSGRSGLGCVAKGCAFYSTVMHPTNGDGPVVKHTTEHVILSWIKEPQSISIWRSMEEMESVHGHEGATQVVWVDDAHEWMEHPTWYDTTIHENLQSEETMFFEGGPTRERSMEEITSTETASRAAHDRDPDNAEPED